MTDNHPSSAGLLRDELALTVTMFGAHDAIDQAISDELGRRGCRTHSVSVETGWLESATNAILRLDTVAGASALEGLKVNGGPCAHVVAICLAPADARDSERLRHLCEECGITHDVSLIWHDAVGTFEAPPSDDVNRPARQLALTVVDEVSGQADAVVRPSFSARFLAS